MRWWRAAFITITAIGRDEMSDQEDPGKAHGDLAAMNWAELIAEFEACAAKLEGALAGGERHLLNRLRTIFSMVVSEDEEERPETLESLGDG